MRVLVAYATKYGATAGIAERIGETLGRSGLDVDVVDVDRADPAGYDAFVLGSAAYAGHWRKEARKFVKHHHDELDTHPVWLFSSGPLGDQAVDDKGRDVRATATPKDVAGLVESLHARDHRVFFGKLDPDALTGPEGLMTKLPVGRKLLPEGDFRDWDEIEGWAQAIGRELQPA
ncbi:flavodoxin domain-containing protein [Nocardioides ungokensis]|uniref:flavodoxin domain-containing protein n=1 Tax=Nocardioides ungokensis TaxID=1643322 RepID=UPI0015DF345B|nr:flavodoxin domain-containing protein [Nocardioides ungokensis]